MNKVSYLYNEFMNLFNVPNMRIPVTFVKFFKNNEEIPESLKEYETENITLTSCQANKQAALGDAVLLTKNNIGCIAAAITFGLVDQNDENQFSGSRVYTDIMKSQAHLADKFSPPSPKDFTEGLVYACKESEHPDYCLFGKNDSGRFKTREIAKKAIKQMTAIQPPAMKAVFFYSTEFEDEDIIPDIVTMDVRPVELTRIIQAYQFLTGERVSGSMGPVRVVNSDLIVRPYLENSINFSSYCVGARLIAEYDANRLGLGMPFNIFETIITGMKESQTGYPFEKYPGV